MRAANLRLAFAAVAVLWSGLAMAMGPQYRLYVDGLACPFCSFGIEKQLHGVEGVQRVETHIDDGAVVVTMDEGRSLTEETADQAVRGAGFTLKRFEEVGEQPCLVRSSSCANGEG